MPWWAALLTTIGCFGFAAFVVAFFAVITSGDN